MVPLTEDDVQTLIEVADFYHQSMGPMRHVVRMTTLPATRSRFRFVSEESKWLRLFTRATLDQMRATGESEHHVSVTPRSLVALWGRLLASLNSRRSRRRMSDEEALHREALARKFREAAVKLASSDPNLLRAELETRRPVERQWMLEQLADIDPQ
jgi:hypothetical protein